MIVIVEPHPDDVLLSCSHLLATDAPKLIVSVGKNDSAGSARLADWYPGVQAVAFNLPNIPWKDKSDANEVKKAADPLSFVREKLHARPDYAGMYEVVRSALLTYSQNTDVFVPVGLCHPYYILVREVCDEVFPKASHYADMPYAELGWGKAIEQAYRMGDFESRLPDPRRLEAYEAVYPTERSLLGLYRKELQANERVYVAK